MRIITGKARGTKLDTPQGDNTRPTLEQVKEAVFSMIQFDLQDKWVLDLFAGSGQMGLEALSRGAAHATFIDNSRTVVGVIEKNALKTRLSDNCTIVRSDWADFIRMKGNREKYDFVFLDPPYDAKLIPGVLNMLKKYNMLRPTSLIICETAQPDDVFCGDFELSGQYDVIKRAKYGTVHVAILALSSEANNT